MQKAQGWLSPTLFGNTRPAAHSGLIQSPLKSKESLLSYRQVFLLTGNRFSWGPILENDLPLGSSIYFRGIPGGCNSLIPLQD